MNFETQEMSLRANNLCTPIKHDIHCASLCGVEFLVTKERREKRAQRESCLKGVQRLNNSDHFSSDRITMFHITISRDIQFVFSTLILFDFESSSESESACFGFAIRLTKFRNGLTGRICDDIQ